MQLFDYQTQAVIDARRAIANGARSVVMVAPTGAGKTVIGSNIIQSAADKGTGSLFFAHRRELIDQTCDKLEAFGVTHGVIMAGEVPRSSAITQVASVDTFRARVIKREKMRWPDVKVLMIDECHRAMNPTYQKIIDYYLEAGAILIGLTATPIRADGKGLGQTFDAMVKTPGIPELIKMGRLVKPVHFAPTLPDLTAVSTKRGDYDNEALQQAMDKAKLVGDIVSHWHRHASDRPTIVFASGVKHSIHLRDEFLKSGIKAAHVDGNTPEDERANIVRDLREGRLQVITNYGVFTEGFDCPDLSAVILARPTKNIGLYLQMAGRGLRTADGKSDCLILDHAGSIYHHGKVDDHQDWQLEMGRKADKEVKRERKIREQTNINCEKCSAVYAGQLNCPVCNHTPEIKGRFVVSKEGELVQIDTIKDGVSVRNFDRYEKVKWWSMFNRYAQEQGYKPGWAWWKYKAKFKGEEPGQDFPINHNVELSAEFHAYIRYLNIRASYAERNQRAAG